MLNNNVTSTSTENTPFRCTYYNATYNKISIRSYGILLFTAVLLIIQTSTFASQSTAKNSSTKKYISQTYVDTSIQRAFYILNEAASIAGVGFKQKQAIEEAKSIARNLRQKAKGDQNERYVNWKVGELEAQIYLEEKEIMLMQMQQGQVNINQLVSRYNAEVGKSRPDFASMRRMHVQMGVLDGAKANQMADSYNQRYSTISNDVLNTLQKALQDGNLDKAREELGYSLRNSSYLSLSNSTYARFETQVEQLETARHEKPLIEDALRSAISALEKNKLSVARDNLSQAEGRLNTIKKFLPNPEYVSLSSQVNKGNQKLVSREDSLVTLNLSILSKRGIAAADDFLRNTLRPYGVSIDKAAFVDKAILSVRSPENNSKMSAEIGSVSSNGAADETQPAVLDDLMARAKKKAQEKTDSLRRIEEEALRIALTEQHRQDSIAEAIRAAELIVFQKKQDQAQSISIDIYSSLENSQIQSARQQFNKERPFLLSHLDKNDFYILESTIQQFSTTIAQQLPALPTQPVAKPISDVAFNKDPARHNVPALDGYSDPLPKAIEEKLNQNQERAEKEIAQLYSLLEKNQIDHAYSRFQEIRKPLQMFLQNDVFAMLESTILQAWEFKQGSKNSR